LQFSPDGKRLIAGDYPGGVIAVWDVASGKRLITLETGYGYRSTAKYFSVAPDWKTVYVSREKRKAENIEQYGKRMRKWTFDGDVRAWSLDDGKLVRTYKHQPPRGIWWMTMSPDGSKLLTAEHQSGISEGGYPEASEKASLWNVKTGERRPVAGLETFGTFSHDGRLLAFALEGKDLYARGLKLIETDTGREKWTLPIPDKKVWVSAGTFSRDGQLLFGSFRQFQGAKKYESWRLWLKWWDVATGREVASFEGDKNDGFTYFHLSPDGQTLAALNWQGEKRKLYLFSVPQKRLLRTTVLGEKPRDFRLLASGGTFSPDGKWLVVITRVYPDKARGDDMDARDLPQPRIHLIEAATGVIRETLIAPQSFSSNACFSPDGRTLATDGPGRILLWDMTTPPGTIAVGRGKETAR
jgi:WD40 repeat protein